MALKEFTGITLARSTDSMKIFDNKDNDLSVGLRESSMMRIPLKDNSTDKHNFQDFFHFA